MMVGLLFGAIAVTACLMPAQADTYWHLRAGQEFWSTLRVPLDEHYSYTAAGRPWPNHEWLWQALSYGLYRAGGMKLLLVGGAAIVMAAFGLAYRLTVGPTPMRFWLTLLALPLASCVWALRPQILSLLLLAALLALLAAERYRWLPLLFVLWANAHGAVALGGLALGAAAVVALLRARGGDGRDRRRALTLALMLPVCAAATALTPLGPGLWRFIGESMESSRKTYINEWLPTYPTGPVEIAFWLLAIAFVVLLVRRRHRLVAASWPDQAIVAVAIAILPLAFRAVRNIAPFLLVALPASSRLLGADFRLRRARPEAVAAPASPDHPRANLAILVAFAVLGAGAVGAAWAASYRRLGWQPIAPGALAAARACPGPLYNRYNEGGFLIWFAPERRVFIDSRKDPYPLPFLLEAIRAEQGKPYAPLFERWGVRCAILPVESPLLPRLRDDRWRSLYLDDEWAVLETPAPPR
jgi:hypothetical protein